MLVSKIKPCKSKYTRPVQWNCEWLIKLIWDTKEQPVSTICHSAGKSPFTTQHETNQIMNMKDLQDNTVFPLPWAQRTSRKLRKVIADEFIVVAVDRFWLSLQYLSSVFTPDDTQHRTFLSFIHRGETLCFCCATLSPCTITFTFLPLPFSSSNPVSQNQRELFSGNSLVLENHCSLYYKLHIKLFCAGGWPVTMNMYLLNEWMIFFSSLLSMMEENVKTKKQANKRAKT